MSRERVYGHKIVMLIIKLMILNTTIMIMSIRKWSAGELPGNNEDTTDNEDDG